MAVTPINATPGDPGQNAYVTVAMADQYHKDRVAPDNDVWTSASPDQKAQAILWASKLLDSLYTWTGYVANFDQPMMWPRWGMFERNDWKLIPSTVIPKELQWATAEYARCLIASDRVADSDIETQRITSVRAGSVEIGFALGVTAKPLPDSVFYLLPPSWGYPRSRSTGVREAVRS